MFKLCITGNLSFEVWQDIPGYKGLYQASTLGRIRSFYYNRVLKVSFDKRGYLRVKLYKNGKGRTCLVHRLVAITFLQQFPKQANVWRIEVNHKDENKANNRVENLEWCTSEYNAHYGTHYQRVAMSHIDNPKKCKPVSQFDLEGNLINSFISAKDAYRKTGFHNANIGACCRGLIQTAYGFVWKYA